MAHDVRFGEAFSALIAGCLLLIFSSMALLFQLVRCGILAIAYWCQRYTSFPRKGGFLAGLLIVFIDFCDRHVGEPLQRYIRTFRENIDQ